MNKESPKLRAPKIPGARPQSSFQKILQLVRRQDPHKDLGSIFETADAAAPLEDRILWLENLVAWLRGPAIPGESVNSTKSSLVRVRFLLQLLERKPVWKNELRLTLNSILADTEAPSLFVQVELTEQSGLFTELARRSVDRIAPPAPRPQELGYVVDLVFSHYNDAEWVEGLSSEEWDQLVSLFALDDPETEAAHDSVKRSLADAILTLSVQAASIGFSPEVRSRMRGFSGPHIPSPFLELNRSAVLWYEGLATPDLRLIVENCRQALASAYESIEKSGVSLSLLYRLETLGRILQRIELILSALAPAPDAETSDGQARALFVDILHAQRSRRSVRELLRMNFDVFARKLVEHAGETGEHYITRTKKEYWAMFRSGAGGGITMVPALFIKFVITSLHLPLFFEGLFVGINYSATFLAMQFMGFSLATKQPAMTAAALAEKLKATMNRAQLMEFVEEVVRITRSQFIAAIGNVGLVMPGALAVALAFKAIFGHTILSAAYAEQTLLSLHPWKSLSLLYAAIAGVLLWLSSLCAGWLQNWVTYRGLPQAIARHRRLNDIFGDRRCRALGEWLGHHATGIGGNVSIGFLLAFVPVAGHFFGLPLDIRHVTLSSGSLVTALVSLDPSVVTWGKVLPALLGVALIGVLNFAVSTALALFVAVHAQRVRGAWVRALLKATAQTFRKSPLRFVLPPSKHEEAESTHSP